LINDQDVTLLDFFLDLQPKKEDFSQAALKGLSLPEKSIPPKFFYDEKGSQLFDLICETPEYYITRTEVSLLKSIQSDIRLLVTPGSSVVEYGCGSSHKIRALLSALTDPAIYIPIDISKSHLITTAREVAVRYPKLKVGAICADFSGPIRWPEKVTSKTSERLAFFPGSTIGNQSPREALLFLKNVQGMVGKEGKLLIGVDTKKDENILWKAYNDSQGHTANFNLNLLRRIKNELEAEISISEFFHDAFYNSEFGRIEMHLKSKIKQNVRINGVNYSFETGESIHTENSYKYSKDEFIQLAKKSGFELLKVWSDDENLFAIYLLQVT